MEAISLLPNTGVQYIELPKLFTEQQIKDAEGKWEFNAKKELWHGLRQVEQSGGSAPMVDDFAGGDPLSDDGFSLDDLDATPRGGDGEADTIRIESKLSVAMEMLQAERGWMPLPFNATTSLWTKIWIGRSADDPGSYDAVLALDTTLTPHGEGGTLAENCLPGTFKIEPVMMAVFWNSDPIKQYVHRHTDRFLEDEEIALLEGADAMTPGYVQSQMAAFYTFLSELDAMPAIKIESNKKEESLDPIDVTVVVDFGNCRTCCVLREMEELPGRAQFYPLQLRNPRRPMEVITEPAQTQLAFVDPSDKLMEGAATFNDLSIIRMGKQATDLLGSVTGDTGTRGMSSPKRYLWETELPSDPWQLAEENGDGRSSVIRGAILRRMDKAKPFQDPEFPDDDQMNPNYPRKAGVVFALTEILENAYRQLNSVAHRGAAAQQPGYKRRRVLRNLVIMHPAGMHPIEVYEFRRAVDRAARLWSEFRTDVGAFLQGLEVEPDEKVGVPIPNVLQVCDEGLAVQVCYLYGEVMHRFNAKPQRLLAVKGRKRINADRPNDPPRENLRLASIDIGGGTIDLAIADYQPSPETIQASFQVQSVFYDGISVGGDDIAKEMLERLIFPAVAEQMGVDPKDWNTLFSARAGGGVSAEWPMIRRNLVTTVWVPLVYGCLRRIEEGMDVDATVGELLGVINDGVINQLNQYIAKIVSDDSSGRELVQSIKQVRLSFTQLDALSVVRRSIGAAISQFCDLVAQYDADVLVLAGRPSGLPAVRQLLIEAMPVPPGSLVFMQGQEIGDWFPFTKGGKVGDSKTIGVVGAALAFLARYNSSKFVLRFPAKETPPVNILGVLQPEEHTLNSSFELFPDGSKLSNPIPFEGDNVIIGFKRIDHPYALARPAYRLMRDPTIERMLSQSPVQNEVSYIRLSREGEQQNMLRIRDVKGVIHFRHPKTGEIVSQENNPKVYSCRLQTMLQNEYWLDSGCFDEIQEEEDSNW